MTQTDVPIAQLLGYLNAADHADVAIVIAPMRHGIGVRSHDDRWQPMVGAFAAADQIACGVYSHVEPRLLHQAPHVGTTGNIRIAKCHSTDSALRICAQAR